MADAFGCEIAGHDARAHLVQKVEELVFAAHADEFFHCRFQCFFGDDLRLDARPEAFGPCSAVGLQPSCCAFLPQAWRRYLRQSYACFETPPAQPYKQTLRVDPDYIPRNENSMSDALLPQNAQVVVNIA